MIRRAKRHAVRWVERPIQSDLGDGRIVLRAVFDSTTYARLARRHRSAWFHVEIGADVWYELYHVVIDVDGALRMFDLVDFQAEGA